MTHRTGRRGSGLVLPGLSLARRLAVAAAVVLAAAPLARAADPKVLNVYNWSDYIADDTIKNFEKETGIKVNYDNYDSNEVLLAKLVAGNTGYDIVVPGAHFAKTEIEGGLLQKLDRSKLTNWSNLDPALLKQLAAVDPGNQYLVDWLWGYVTIGINVPKVKAALGDLPMPDNAWSLIFDPKSSSGYINDLAGGSLCAVMGYSGDINIARARALEANPKQPAAIEALIPKGGATLFFDSMAIPKDAKNVANAHLFINYIMRPEVAASLTNKVFYANPNAASLKFVKKDVAENKTIFLSAADKARMTPPDAVPQAIRRVQTRIFTNFKAGR
jgi:putrescine transport system substrate-binding protein